MLVSHIFHPFRRFRLFCFGVGAAAVVIIVVDAVILTSVFFFNHPQFISPQEDFSGVSYQVRKNEIKPKKSAGKI